MTEERTKLGPINVGRAFSCVVDRAGSVTCWGSDVANGAGEPGPRDQPPWLRRIGKPTGAVDISTDYGDTCVVYDDGELWCRNVFATAGSQPPGGGLIQVPNIAGVIDVAG
ncbi:MAG: hypothetical protein ACI9OJ_005021 [Myxococcota bacterium]|jgi:hypothetical protein